MTARSTLNGFPAACSLLTVFLELRASSLPIFFGLLKVMGMNTNNGHHMFSFLFFSYFI